MFKKILPLVIVIGFAYIAGIALLHPGLPPTHDGEYHVIRFYEFNKVLNDGNWYPRWAPDLNFGFGVPIFNYVYPLPNYIASLFHALGFSFIDSFKLSMLIATTTGAIFMYLWAKIFWGEKGAIVSSVFYTFSPYHFVDIYIRGSVGEVWALGFFPVVLWLTTQFSKSRDKRYFVFSSLFFALTIFSHNILGLMFFPFIISYVFVFNRKRKELFLPFVFIFILALSLSAVFWLPALLEKKYVVGLEIYDVLRNFPDLYQLIIPSWGSGFFGDGSFGNQMSVQIGLANLLIVMLSPIALYVFKKKSDGRFPILMFFLVWFLVLFFLMTTYSIIIWRNIPFMDYFQFPWRFLSLVILVCSFLAGSITLLGKSKITVPTLVLLTFFLGIGYTKPAYYLMRSDSYYISRSNFIDGTNSPGNMFNTIWMSKKLQREKNKIENSLTVKVLSENIRSTHYRFRLDSSKDTQVIMHTLFFPGWKTSVNEKQIQVKNSNGLLSFFIPKGRHEIEVVFGDTPIRAVSKIISLFSLCVIVFLLFRKINFVTINE